MNQVAIVTGTSSGIGLATALALAKAGQVVIATVRDERGEASVLEQAALAGVRLDVRRLDVTQDASVAAMVSGVLADHGRIDVLVNNAGLGHRGTLEQLTLAEMASSMDVNFWGVARMTQAVLPGMRAARRGRIVTVTSMNGLIAMPFSDAYNAAKFAVEGLMEGLAPVMAAFGVHVSVVEPGPVHTSFFSNMTGKVGASGQEDPYAAMMGRYNDALAAAMKGGGEKPEGVAAVILEAVTSDAPRFRYQSSPVASAMAARKINDVTGQSIVQATRALIG
ncbi:SDR family oxidoreductase [Melittangium boletus]|uniref:Short-chain dehydrogenase/reductase n=1 Tax=Melittangium boletus DSM 14713 TaxID=1294270 RepID=A0A250IEP7_9BACT|nr:SDR family oxidoreductase [Melittangium boletus]ATB29713.1 short-chain dehydrogenase/reductase [Melittangium boletus DSM 14713]